MTHSGRQFGQRESSNHVGVGKRSGGYYHTLGSTGHCHSSTGHLFHLQVSHSLVLYRRLFGLLISSCSAKVLCLSFVLPFSEYLALVYVELMRVHFVVKTYVYMGREPFPHGQKCEDICFEIP